MRLEKEQQSSTIMAISLLRKRKKKKEKAPSICYRINEIFKKIESKEGKSEFVKYVAGTITKHMFQEDI